MNVINESYGWLHEKLMHHLNPEALPIETRISHDLLEEVQTQLPLLKENLLLHYQEQLVLVRQKNQFKTLVRMNQNEIVKFTNRAFLNSTHERAAACNAETVNKALVEYLQEIDFFLKDNYREYLGDDSRVALPALLPIKELIEQQHELLVEKLSAGSHGNAPVFIVQEVIDNFMSKIEQSLPVSHHEAQYIEQLIGEILNLNMDREITDCPPLNELLLLWNVNTKTAIIYFTRGFEGEVMKRETDTERLEYIRLQRKVIKQIPVNPNVTYNPSYPSLVDYFKDWMRYEIKHLQFKRQTLNALDKEPAVKEPGKILVGMSIDQLAIIIRSAFEGRYIKSKSLSWIFQVLIPYLSTDRRTDLSWRSARNKCDSPEKVDVERAIEILEDMQIRLSGY